MGKTKKTVRKAHCRTSSKGVYLNQVRVEKGLTIDTIAKRMGFKTSGNLGAWFAGRAPVPERHVPSLAQALGIDVKDIPESAIRRGVGKKGKANHAPCAFTDTFWSRKRVECGKTIDAVAEATGCHRVLVGKYFTGMYMPNDEIIKKFCDLFEVEFMRGKGEFHKAHQSYKALHHRAPAVCKGNKPKAELPEVPEQIPTAKPEVKPIIKTETSVTHQVLELLYGKLDYEDFMKVTDALEGGDYSEPMKMLYGHVDFKLFTAVDSLLTSTT